ncbi:l-isoaspartate(d-aspartate) o-methyltransferase [Diaporthe amygdali]|uniref:l-isoaspartate(d-aspartate) o-methyltransferase n=1 Tax=Phomopsis amygdali TaxID=1214568 RepID=UPI0022FDEAFC|nr:l-isoaspartate(d-aspartate) o-methyltransferase [Diaporthe amygdali]KAJ0119129.1 l-isoaspartate(d-aspartate) o-methyltransferase [Diaporthe amygdali]
MAQEFGSETQSQSAQRMYNTRASNYEDSWHPDYSRRFVALVPLKPGHRVLDLCCGTGLDAFLAAEVVGDQGEIVAVDVSSGMLEQLRERQNQEPELGGRIRTFNHDVTNLDGVPGLEKGSFDAILCSCAFVLLEHSAQVVAHWKEYLKPGGIMAIDVTHEWNLRPGLVLEHAANRLGVKFPSNRLWIRSIESFKEVLGGQGMAVEKAVELERQSGKGSVFYGVDEADDQFEYFMNGSLAQNVASESFKANAKPLFREEWERIAVNGKVESVDASYVYIARAPQ